LNNGEINLNEDEGKCVKRKMRNDL